MSEVEETVQSKEVPEDGAQKQEEEQPTTVKEEREIIKVNNYCITDLKNTCDDYIIKYFTTKEGYNQINTHTDVKLVLGYLSCGFALSGGYYGHITPFEESKTVTLICIVAYSILNFVLLAYTYFFEKDILFMGRESSFDSTSKIIIRTDAKRSSDVYSIKFEFIEDKTNDQISSCNISKSFGSWFDVNGVMDQERFEGTLNEGHEAAKSGKKPKHE